MRRRTQRIGLVMTALLIFTLFLAACGTTSSPTSSSPTPPTQGESSTSSPTLTPTLPPRIVGEFDGQIASVNAGIGLSTDGSTLTAFTTDGPPPNTPSFSLWFKGPVMHNAVHLQAEFGAGADLAAILTSQFATGSLTLNDGRSFSFTAERNHTDPPIQAGLYQGQLTTADGTRYLAGWVVLPSTAASTGTQVQTGGIIDEQHSMSPIGAPVLTAQDVAMQMVMSDLGNFQLMLYRSGEPVPIPTVANFTATLNPSSVNCQQSPGQSELVLDNTASNVDVSWTISFQEMNPSQRGFWGTASSDNGTVLALQQGKVVITPSSDLCKANNTMTYHLQVSYNAASLPQQSTIVLDYMVVVQAPVQTSTPVPLLL